MRTDTAWVLAPHPTPLVALSSLRMHELTLGRTGSQIYRQNKDIFVKKNPEIVFKRDIVTLALLSPKA